MFALRKTIATAAVSLAAAAGLGLLLPASPASAEVLANTNSIHLGAYQVPFSPPAYNASTPVLPGTDGTFGRPTRIVLSGGSSAGTGTQALEAPGQFRAPNQPIRTTSANSPDMQSWYFQRVGYVGVINPAVNPEYSTRLATPVYKIVHYAADGPECAIADGSASAGTILETAGCDVVNNDTGELWLVGSPDRTNNIIDAGTGLFTGGWANQYFSPPLQGGYAGVAGDYQHSVLENLSSVDYNRWDVTKATVLSADFSGTDGTYGSVAVRGQTQSGVTVGNSTWNLVPA